MMFHIDIEVEFAIQNISKRVTILYDFFKKPVSDY